MENQFALICKTYIFEADEGWDSVSCKNCTIIFPYNANTQKPSYCYICGNFIQEGDEQCENGNITGCFNCKLDRGYFCQVKILEFLNCSTICGDG